MGSLEGAYVQALAGVRSEKPEVSLDLYGAQLVVLEVESAQRSKGASSPALTVLRGWDARGMQSGHSATDSAAFGVLGPLLGVEADLHHHVQADHFR